MSSFRYMLESRYVVELLGSVIRGDLKIISNTEFRRIADVSGENVLKLLNRIVCGYPINPLFVWNSDCECSCYDEIWGFDFDENASKRYVVNGGGILFDLMFSLLFNHGESRLDDPYRVYLNTIDNKFEHVCEPGFHHWPAWKLVDTIDFLSEKKKKEDMSDGSVVFKEKFNDCIQCVQKVAYAIQNCQVPGLVLDGDIDSVVEAHNGYYGYDCVIKLKE